MSLLFFLFLGCNSNDVADRGSVHSDNGNENTDKPVVHKEVLDVLLSSGKCSAFLSACIDQGVPQADCTDRHKHCLDKDKKTQDSSAQDRRKALWQLSQDGKCEEFKSECQALKIPVERCEAGFKKCTER